MNRRYIIFADDDPDDLELITGFVRQFDPDLFILEFKDGLEVLRFLEGAVPRGHLPALIILDMNMPRMNGKETLSALRRRDGCAGVPVVIYTTSSSESDRQYFHSLDAQCINKPDQVEGVRQVARRLTEYCHA